jgi:hypothetical protein
MIASWGLLGRSLLPPKHFQIQTSGVVTPGDPGQRTTESVFKRVTPSQNPEAYCFLSLMVVAPVLFFTWLEKMEGSKGTKGIYFGEKWAQVATLWGNRNLKSPYLENSFQRVAKLYPKVFCFTLWPLSHFGCPLGRDGQPTDSTDLGEKIMLLLAVDVLLELFLTWKISFHPIQRTFHEKYGRIRHTLRVKFPYGQSS